MNSPVMQELIEPTKEQVVRTNPFPGLRPFRQEENHLFFGRENQINEVLTRLIGSKFVAVIGNSGIGKSSFINCGILPKIYSNYPTSFSNRWDIVAFRPGSTPINNLADAFADTANKDRPAFSPGFISPEKVRDILLSDANHGLEQLFNTYLKPNQKNLLIYIDQFEEIFRYKKDVESVSDEVALFIEILIDCARNNEMPAYVIMTMRSDFVGDCSRYPMLTAAINESQFLIPQMTREEKQSAIVGPIGVMGATIDENLVNEILNDIGDANDQLPVMQHALMRTWDYWTSVKAGNQQISSVYYQATGGMKNALSIHANEIFNDLEILQKNTCEKIFKSITEKGEEGRTVRRPASIDEICKITQGSSINVTEIIDQFRKPGRTLLTPPSDVELTSKTIIDISHESLMRIWETLRQWLEEEYESVKQYQRIAEASEMHQLGKGGLMRPPELQIALNWQEQQNPTKEWAIRYDASFDRTMQFLTFSKTQFLREQRLKEKQQKRRLAAAKITAIIFGAAGFIALMFFLYAQNQRQEAVKQKEIAKTQAVRAEEQATIAMQKTEEALDQKKVAMQQTARALYNEKIANQQKQRAEIERQHAVEQKEIANEANKKATSEERKATKLRMLSIARSMAIKSLQEPDKVTKSLVAKQAYNYYTDLGETSTDHDVYIALYYAVKSLKGNNFNLIKGHTDNVRAITTSGNSPYLYSAGSDGNVYKWRPAINKKIVPEPLYADSKLIHKSISLSKNGKKLVCGGNYPYLLLFDPEKNPMPIEQVKIPFKEIWFLSFTPDNNGIVFVSADKRIMFYDFKTVSEISRTDLKINSIDIDPRGQYIALGKEGGKVILIDRLNNNKQTVFYTAPGNVDVTSVKFNNDGSTLAIGELNGAVRLIDISSGKVQQSLLGHTAMVNQISFNHAGNKMATASFDHTVRIWELDALNAQPIKLDDHRDWVWSVAFSSDDKYLLAGCRDNIIRAWPVEMSDLAMFICTENGINRNLTQKEWNSYASKDIDYECSCSSLPPGDGAKKKIINP
jgi:WD40 repeat protein/ABC-type oligopeptide transport system ATPase subunit